MTERPDPGDEQRTMPKRRPRIVCISGSMRFLDTMLDAAADESLAGRVVLLPVVNMNTSRLRWATRAEQDEIKARLDRLHLDKIDLADELLVVNPGRYVGDSTRREIEYAADLGKPVRYLVAPDHPRP